MADVIKCPVCGEENAADQEFCQYCQSRLQPLTGPLKGADAPLQPGQIPTKKVTAELEPILPQWLREARDKARHSVDDEVSKGLEQQQPWSGVSEPDLLAGLRSQSRSDEEEETPDWLANITGLAPKARKGEGESTEARRVELGGKGDFNQEAAASEEAAPSWLTAMQSAAPVEEKDELKDWFRESSGFDERRESASGMDSSGWPEQMPSGGAAAFSKDKFFEPAGTDTSDWLNQPASTPETGAAISRDMPSWLGADSQGTDFGAAASAFAAAGAGAVPDSDADVPGWLQGFDSTPASAEPVSKPPSEDDWLKEHQPKAPEPPLKKHTMPLWLKGTEADGATAEEAETPPWLMDATTTASAAPAAPALPQQDEGFGDIPSWLKAAAPQSSIFDETPAATTPEKSDWLESFKDVKPASPEPPAAPAFSTDQSPESGTLPAFTEDAFRDGSVDGLFTEMPDWLTSAAVPASEAGLSEPGGADTLAPGELPSWVQAMRPVEPDLSKTAPPAEARTIETRGALSGLQGVLPAVPGYKPSSKPRVYSIKLQATQEQQAHAALLEQILAAETEPVPITSFSPLRTSRGFRWMISALLLLLIPAVVSLNTQIFALPSTPRPEVPNAFHGALQVAQNVPEDSPVLVAVDYQPARAGEMEASAAPMFDQMILLRHPRLSFISTNETGPILAERFMSGTLRERGYLYGSQYLNLGYLPGGVMGIRAFAQNPPLVMPLDISLELAWNLPPLQGVSSLSQFSALIIVTDSAESARTWVEQTTALRGVAPVVVITSAQAAPMILPYYDSGQVSGIVDGLHGGAIFEQNNAGRPGTVRRYWDAYSLGMLLAMSMMLAGGFWSLMLGMRERAAAREGG